MVPWGSLIRRRGQWWRYMFLHLFPKNPFFLSRSCPTNPHGQWLPTELGPLGWPLPPCPQRLCTGVPAPDHPLFPCVTATAISPGRNLHLSAVCIRRGCAFQPHLSALCLPIHSPTACSRPRIWGWFLPSQTTASRTRLSRSGAGPGQVTGGAARAHRSPHGLCTLDLAGAPLRSCRHSSNLLLLRQSDRQSWRNKIRVKFWLSSF